MRFGTWTRFLTTWNGCSKIARTYPVKCFAHRPACSQSDPDYGPGRPAVSHGDLIRVIRYPIPSGSTMYMRSVVHAERALHPGRGSNRGRSFGPRGPLGSNSSARSYPPRFQP